MTKRGYVPIPDVQSPSDPDGRVTVYVSVSDFHQTQKFHPWKAHLMASARDVLQAPECILEARRNVGNQEIVGYCYTGRPEMIPDGRNGMRSLPDGNLIAVYVDLEFHLWEWGLEPHGDDPLIPIHSESRFGERLF